MCFNIIVINWNDKGACFFPAAFVHKLHIWLGRRDTKKARQFYELLYSLEEVLNINVQWVWWVSKMYKYGTL